MLNFSTDQVRAFENAQQQAYLHALIPYVQNRYPAQINHLDQDGVQQLIDRKMAHASRYGFETKRDIRLFIDFSITLGADFDSDPQLDWAREILCADRSPWTKMNRLQARANFYRQAVLGCGVLFPVKPFQLLSARWLHKLQRENITQQAMTTLLCDIWPKKVNNLGDRLYAVLDQKESPLEDVISHNELIVLAFLLGFGFDRDPLHPWSQQSMNRQSIWAHTAGIFAFCEEQA